MFIIARVLNITAHINIQVNGDSFFNFGIWMIIIAWLLNITAHINIQINVDSIFNLNSTIGISSS